MLNIIRVIAVFVAMFGFAIMIKEHFTEPSSKMKVDTSVFSKNIKEIDNSSLDARIESGSKEATESKKELKVEEKVKPSSLTAKELGEIILKGEVNKLDSLLNNGMNPNIICDENQNTCLMFSTIAGGVDSMRVLLKHGANPNIINKQTQSTPLLMAIASQNRESVALLLEHKADPNLKTYEDGSPLAFASSHSNKEIIEIIIAAGGRY